MPNYTYACAQCGHEIDISHGMNEEPEIWCPLCAQTNNPLQYYVMEKKPSAPAVRVKDKATGDPVIDKEDSAITRKLDEELHANKLRKNRR